MKQLIDYYFSRSLIIINIRTSIFFSYHNYLECDIPNYNIDEEEITEKIDKLQKDVDDIVYIMKYQIVPALNYLIKKI